MKAIILVSLLLVGCGESVNKFGSLTQQEKDYLIEQGKQQCLQDNKQDFNSFKSQSADQFAELERGDYYLHEVKNGSTVLRSIKVQVWKNLSGNLYFILTTTTAEDSTPSYQFLKITPAINSEMVDKIATARCLSGTNGVTASSNGSNITYTKEITVPIEGEKKTVTTKTNTASFQYLAFFANYNYSQSVRTLTLDDVATDPPEVKTTGSFNPQTTIDLAFSSYTGYTGATFCVPYVPGASNDYTFPFTLNCNAGATAEFNPTELSL